MIDGGTGRRRPRRVDGKGLHDVGHCAYGGWHARHSALQTEFVASTQEAGAWVRKTNVKELRAIRSSRSQRQGDAAIDFFGPMQETAVIDFVVVHPLAATYSYRYGQAGDAAKVKEEWKHGKYDEAAAAAGVRFIPFAVETYGKMGKEALRLLRTLQQDRADSAPPSALRPWHARTFVDSAVQRLSIALQRSIQRDQILRSRLRRGKGGNDAAPDGYYHGCGDGGYESGASSSSSSDGGGGGAGRFGGGGHSLIGGGSASAAPGRRAPRSAGEGTGP